MTYKLPAQKKSYLFISLTSAFFILISACGGGGGGDSGGSTGGNLSTPTLVILSGKVTYTDYDILPTGGIQYGSPLTKPVRGAKVELQALDGSVIQSANLLDTGDYSFSVDVNTTVRIVVYAALGVPGTTNTEVLDNTNANAPYKLMSININVGTNDITYDMHADSGWTGLSYTGERAAAPFAILDVLYQAQEFMLSIDSTLWYKFPLLKVYWSKNNAPIVGDPALGQIGTTSYYDKSINSMYVLGSANTDTDEYDSHVIAHEWVHYFIKNFSRSDSPGGDHIFFNDILHPSLAYDEGIANAMAAMILNDSVYVVSYGIAQAQTHWFDIEKDNVPDTQEWGLGVLQDGMYAEHSVGEVIYDLFDSGNSDDDSLHLSPSSLYHVLVNGQINSQAFTSIASFLFYLKVLIVDPATDNAIDALALAENIQQGNEFEAPALPFPLYTEIPTDGTLITAGLSGPLQTSNIFGPVTADNPGNKYNNFIFFHAPAVTGCYTFTATPITGTTDLLLATPSVNGFIDNTNSGKSESYAHNYTLDEPRVFSVGAFIANAIFNVKFAPTPSACTP